MSTPSQIFIGTNQLDSGGHVTCKLISSPAAIVLKAQELSRVFDDRGKLIFDSNRSLWRAIGGDADIDATKNRVIRSLEDSAARFILLREQYGFDGLLSKEKFLVALRAHIALATVNNGQLRLDLFAVTFTGWPKPEAHAISIAIPDHSKSFALAWVGDGIPSASELRPGLNESDISPVILMKLQSLAETSVSNKLAFQPPFHVIALSNSGSRLIDGDQAPCSAAQKKALSSRK